MAPSLLSLLLRTHLVHETVLSTLGSLSPLALSLLTSLTLRLLLFRVSQVVALFFPVVDYHQIPDCRLRSFSVTD
jgi:hypothetical protein